MSPEKQETYYSGDRMDAGSKKGPDKPRAQTPPQKQYPTHKPHHQGEKPKRGKK